MSTETQEAPAATGASRDQVSVDGETQVTGWGAYVQGDNGLDLDDLDDRLARDDADFDVAVWS